MRAVSLPSCFAAIAVAAGVVHPGLRFTEAPVWGVNTHWHYEHPGETAYIAKAGFRLVRTDLSWAASEGPARGQYNFSSLAALYDTLGAHGLRYLATLDYTNPLYDNGVSPFDADGRAGFVAWVLAAVRFLRIKQAPTGVLWELYNEPDLNAGPNCSSASTRPPSPPKLSPSSPAAPNPLGGWYPCANATAYALLAVELGAALKGAFPDEIYVGPALGDMHGTDELDLSFLGVCADAGALEWWDAVTVHPYRPFSPEDAEGPLAQVRTFVASRSPPNRTLPVFSGEWGYSTATDQGWGGPWANETMQGKFLPRMFMLNVAWGVNLSVWYDWHDDGPDAADAESNFGLTRFPYGNESQPYAPKPAYTAMAALTSITAGAGCGAYAGLWRTNVSGPVPLNRTTLVECFAAYWACVGDAPLAAAPAPSAVLAAWCDAAEGWEAQLRIPAIPPPIPSSLVVMRPHITPFCFSTLDWLGHPLSGPLGTVCSRTDGMVQLPVSSGPTYLVPQPPAQAFRTRL